MKRLIIVTRNYRGIVSAGNKAKTDNEDTLLSMGAKNLGLPRTYYHSKIATFFIDLTGIIKFVLNVRNGDVIVLQYPIKKYFSFLCRMAHRHDAKVIALIHDLGSFRRKKLTVEHEIRRLSYADYIIASNERMKQWLLAQGMKRPMGALQLFDYRSECEHQFSATEHHKSKRRVVYAGALNMRKNSFMVKWSDLLSTAPSNYELHVYGNNDGLADLHKSPSLIMHGFTKPDMFIKTVEADFGLVWDGDSLDTCSGNFGEYLRYNSPHKASFYLRAGIPIITWRESAIAEVIEHEHIGFCIDSIRDIDARLHAISDEEMQAMCRNVKAIDTRLKTGDFLRTAIKKALVEIGEEKR